MTNEVNARARIMQIIAKAIMSGEAPDVIDVSGLFQQATDGVCNCPDCQQDRDSATWTSADIPAMPIQPTTSNQWLLSFMAQQPTREMVLETCCAFANGNCLEITDSYIWTMFETLLDLRVEEFFNDTYSLGYLSAEVFGQRNWKVAKGNGKLFTLSSKFDEFVHLAGDLGISAKQLEQLLPARK